MKKVLITLPNSIAGSLIMRGFTAGFRANGCHVLEKDLRDLSTDDIKRYNPDIILGYDYGFLFYEQKDLVDYILNSEQNYKIVHYFADEPNGKFAYVDKPELYQTFVDISKSRKNVFSFMWDKDFVDEFFNCKYLPLAVNYKSYLSNEIIPYEISFVGRPLTDKRQEVLAALVKKFGKKLSIFCYEKHFLQSVDEMKQKQLLSDKELELYKSSYVQKTTTSYSVSVGQGWLDYGQVYVSETGSVTKDDYHISFLAVILAFPLTWVVLVGIFVAILAFIAVNLLRMILPFTGKRTIYLHKKTRVHPYYACGPDFLKGIVSVLNRGLGFLFRINLVSDEFWQDGVGPNYIRTYLSEKNMRLLEKKLAKVERKYGYYYDF